MSSHDRSADHDAPIVVALYLSGLRHGSLYSPAELRRAIIQTYAALDAPESLLPRYREALLAAEAGGENPGERRSWALHMAAVLTWDEQQARRAPSPSAATAASAAAASPSRQSELAVRQLRTARRLPVRVTLTVLAVDMVIAVLATQADGLLGLPVAGPFNVGLVLLLVQLGITAGAAVWYGRYARAAVDPLTERLGSSLPHPESHR
ncbi:DUF485 domain-containing protein [Streptomyces sp. 8N616]|uniref:DUF485 domain-containing protein n=1 Tax=Streptomyces sp. 8N616 TaxID=3457414 RepID=UPI003FD4088A